MAQAVSTVQTAGASKRDASERLRRYSLSRAEAMEAFTKTNRIQTLWRDLTEATDKLLQSEASSRGVTLLAVGGYGRRELFPYSDVDVLILLPESADESASASVIALLQQLWDLHIPVSHAARTLNGAVEAARGDHTVVSALMDARYLAGDRKQYIALKKALKAEVLGQSKRDFVEAKLAERNKRHAKWGDSRFLLEPNVKDGKGGLRDLQTLTWLARYCYGVAFAADLVRPDLLTADERRHYRNAYLFFAVVRAHMHILRGRADDRLTFDLQTQIAAILKFRGASAQARAERFMQRYFQFTRHVGALTRIFCALLEEENLRAQQAPLVQEHLARTLPDYLELDNGRLNFSDTADFAGSPHQMIGLFAFAQQCGLDIHPRAHLLLTRALPSHGRKLPLDGEAGKLFLSILLATRATEVSLRRMNEMGVLEAVLPEFAKITGQMQYDGYHTFTVDEHTLVAVGNIASIESGQLAEEFPLATAVAKEINARAPLYLAMLCHDIAKGQGGGHAGKGEEITKRIAHRLGLSEEDGQLAAWLVRFHLFLSEIAFKRDLDDPKTISDVVAIVQSPERLRLLLLITVADIRAVGPTIWNGWKGALLRVLYQRAMSAMGVAPQGSILPEEQAQQFLEVQPPELQETARGLLAQRLPAGWWFRPAEEQRAVLEVYKAFKAHPKKPAIQVSHDAFRAITELTIAVSYQPQLFRVLAGVMAWITASIVSSRIMVLADGTAIASLGIQDLQGGAFHEEDRLHSLPKLLNEGLSGTLPFDRELPRRRLMGRGRAVAIRPAVFVDNQLSADSTVIEVNARDRLGLLYDILGALAACQLSVMTAHIATYGAKAVDVFYVKDAYGHKVTHKAKRAQVERALLAASETMGFDFNI